MGVRLVPQQFSAPELGSGTWFNTLRPLRLSALRGHVILLDFWTYCCVNCMHVIPMLRALEERFADRPLVVIGVHSGKFDNERHHERVRAALLRHGLTHPVLDDSSYESWRRYGVEAWPTVALIDAEGFLRGAIAGEPPKAVIEAAVEQLLAEGQERRLLAPAPLRTRYEPQVVSRLSFPSKVALVGPTLAISDTNHHRIVGYDLDGSLRWSVGEGVPGYRDGRLSIARFDHPQGLVSDQQGNALFVADTENHLVRHVDLTTGTVTSVAGTGAQGPALPSVAADPRLVPLSTPWEVTLLPGHGLVVANTGTHQLALLPDGGGLRLLAGCADEGLSDGNALEALMAQPSGLAHHQGTLYIADAESSSVRALRLDTRDLRTLVGTGLFDFGATVGPLRGSKLQHPLAVVVAAEQGPVLLIADTYNHRIVRLDVAAARTEAILGDGHPGAWHLGQLRLDEPGGLALGEGILYIADTNNHRIVTLPLDAAARPAGAPCVLPLEGAPRGPPPERPYAQLAGSLPPDATDGGLPLERRLQAMTTHLWQGLGSRDVSWVGFYVPAEGGTQMVLSCGAPKPACSPIGLHGVCGRALRSRRAVIVEDVRLLGEGYVACDPADRSEVVVPLFDDAGEVVAVLDLDSHQVGAFGLADADGLSLLLAALRPSPSAGDEGGAPKVTDATSLRPEA